MLLGKGLQTRELLLDSKSRISPVKSNFVQSLYAEVIRMHKFSRNRDEVFVLDADDVGVVHGVTIRHDNTSLGQDPSFYLHRVEVSACVMTAHVSG